MDHRVPQATLTSAATPAEPSGCPLGQGDSRRTGRSGSLRPALPCLPEGGASPRRSLPVGPCPSALYPLTHGGQPLLPEIPGPHTQGLWSLCMARRVLSCRQQWPRDTTPQSLWGPGVYGPGCLWGRSAGSQCGGRAFPEDRGGPMSHRENWTAWGPTSPWGTRTLGARAQVGRCWPSWTWVAPLTQQLACAGPMATLR